MLTRSIQCTLRSSRQHVVLRRTDKSKVFHLGSHGDYEQKAANYMMKTGAYEEVDNGKCPLADNLSVVIELLDKLLKCKAINMRQWSTMMPNRSKVELGHLYFLPKPHKVRGVFVEKFEDYLTTFITIIDWYTTETYYFVDEWIDK